MMIDSEKIYFPYENIRRVQDRFIQNVMDAIESKKNLIVHAPTGLGKTVAVLSPCLSFALEKDLKVIFLTSRHTQHQLAVDTLKDIQKAHGIEIAVADIIGKKWMCSQPGAKTLFSGEFTEFCRKLREDKACEFYTNTRDNFKLKPKANILIEALSKRISHTEEIITDSSFDKLCPYEVSIELAKRSNVIIADYYYIFHPKVSEMFLNRADIDLTRCIIIVDEAHNLPNRIRDLATTRLTNNILRLAIREAKKFGYDETLQYLVSIQDIMNRYAEGFGHGDEKSVDKEDFILKVEKIMDFDRLIADLEFIADSVRENQRQSYIGSIAGFLEAWKSPTEGFARYIKLTEFRGKPNLVLSNSCLDPSVISRPILENIYSGIMMSGTLNPTEMYRDILGVEDAMENTYPCPFPDRNRLNLVIPKTTTKFTARSNEQYQNIAAICADITNVIPGNSFLFFPSYHLRDRVYQFFSGISKKTCFLERGMLTKEEKKELIDNFKRYKETGAVMLGVASGSFSEGIDLPGDLLKCVVIVGLPLVQPDLETKELISYYDRKFSRGWDYGYIFPAFNKALQSGGRCIRSETDKGVVVFLDERYLWPRYRRLFPEDWDIEVAKDYTESIRRFFNNR